MEFKKKVYKIDEEEKLNLKKKFYKKNNKTNFLEKRIKDNIPYIFPIALVHENNYESSSQLNRFEKLSQIFLNLKYRIQNEEQKEIWCVKEVNFFLKISF